MRRVALIAGLSLVAASLLVVAMVRWSRRPVASTDGLSLKTDESLFVPYGGEFWAYAPGPENSTTHHDVNRRVDDPMSRVLNSFHDRAGRQVARTPAYTAELSPQLVRFNGLTWALSEVSFGDSAYAESEPWVVAGNTAQRRLSADGNLLEHIEARSAGLARSWILKRPRNGDWIVDTHFAGAVHVASDSESIRLVDDSGKTIAGIGPAVLVDAAGARTEVESVVADDSVRYRVSAETLAQAIYPVALDPVLFSEVGVVQSADTGGSRSKNGPALTVSEGMAFIAWSETRDQSHAIVLARYDEQRNTPDGAGKVVHRSAGACGHPDIANNGKKLLVVWSCDDGGSSEGYTVVSLSTLEVEQDVTLSFHASYPKVAADGENFLVVSNGRYFRVRGDTGDIFVDDLPSGIPRLQQISVSDVEFAHGRYFVAGVDASSGDPLILRAHDSGPGSPLVYETDPTALDRAPGWLANAVELGIGQHGLLATWQARDPDAPSIERHRRGRLLDGLGLPVAPTFETPGWIYPPVAAPSAGIPGSADFVFVNQLDSYWLEFYRVFGDTGQPQLAYVLQQPQLRTPSVKRLRDELVGVFAWFNSNRRLYASLFDLEEEPSLDLLAAGENEHKSLSVVSNGDAVLTTWVDDLSGDNDMYSARFVASGHHLDALEPAGVLHASGVDSVTATSHAAGPRVFWFEGSLLKSGERSDEGLVAVESVHLAAPPSEAIAVATRNAADPEAVHSLVAYATRDSERIVAVALDSAGQQLGATIDIDSGCFGCLGHVAVAVTNDTALIVYQKRTSSEEPFGTTQGALVTLGSPTAPAATSSLTVDSTLTSPSGVAANGTPSLVSTADGFAVYEPTSMTTGIEVRRFDVDVHGNSNASQSVGVCAPVGHSCWLAAAASPAYHFVAAAASSVGEVLGWGVDLADGSALGPYRLSSDGAPSAPSIAALPGTSFVVGYTRALELNGETHSRGTLRLVDLSSDVDGDGYSELTGDCDDTNPEVHPGSIEVAGNVVDEDCNGRILCFVDTDHDGYGTSTTVTSSDLFCRPIDGESVSNTDCDDSDRWVWGPSRHFPDTDADGFGDSNAAVVLLCDSTGHAANNLDCNDSDASVNPLGAELAGNDVDEDCNSEWYCIADQDGDGRAGVLAHTAPCGSEYPLTEVRDCNESDPSIHFDAAEVPGNNIDEDCSGDVLCFADADGDGLGTGAVVLSSDTDCNDFGESGDSSDCDDSLLVGAFTAGPVAWFADTDGDGFGDPTGEGGVSCTGPPGYVTNSDDCDDTSSSRRPGAFEACGDAIDANCDGYLDRAACHLDSCSPVSGLATALYQAGTRDPDPSFAPAPLSPSLRIEGLYADGSEVALSGLDNLKLSIDPNTGAANLGGRFEVTGLNSPNGGGGSVGDVWTLSMTLTPSACSGCSPVLNDRTQVHEAVAAWSFYSVSDAKLSSHSLINPQNEFTYEHTLTARDALVPVQFGPAASGESLRCGLRFEFAHMFDFGAGTFSGQGDLILDLVAIPGTETLAAAGGQ